MVVADQHLALFPRGHAPTGPWPSGDLAARIRWSPTMCVRAGIAWMMKDVQQRFPARAAPLQVASIRTVMRTNPQPNPMSHQILQQPIHRTQLLELVEQQPYDRLHLLIRVQSQLIPGHTNVSGDRMVQQFSPPGLVQSSLVQPSLQNVQFGFAHGSFQSQEQAVVVVRRIVQTILIGQQGAKQRTHLQQLMPVFAGAGQAAHLDAQHQPHVIQTHLGQQSLKSLPPFNPLGTLPLIFVDNQDSLLRPAPCNGRRARSYWRAADSRCSKTCCGLD